MLAIPTFPFAQRPTFADPKSALVREPRLMVPWSSPIGRVTVKAYSCPLMTAYIVSGSGKLIGIGGYANLATGYPSSGSDSPYVLGNSRGLYGSGFASIVGSRVWDKQSLTAFEVLAPTVVGGYSVGFTRFSGSGGAAYSSQLRQAGYEDSIDCNTYAPTGSPVIAEARIALTAGTLTGKWQAIAVRFNAGAITLFTRYGIGTGSYTPPIFYREEYDEDRWGINVNAYQSSNTTAGKLFFALFDGALCDAECKEFVENPFTGLIPA